MSDWPGQAGTRLPGRIALLFAGLMHAVVGTFVLATTQLLAAPLALALGVGWTLLAVLIWRWRHVRPLLVLLLPFVAALGLWAAVALSGD